MKTASRKQPQLLLHGRISHNVLATLAASASRSIEEVGEQFSSMHSETWGWSSESESQPSYHQNNKYLFSTSDTGKHLVWASQNYFVILALDETKKEFKVVGQGSGCFQEGERITAVLCLPFFMPSANNGQIFVILGYNTGYIRIFTEIGNLRISQLLDISPILDIKLRTANIPTFSLPASVQSSSQKTSHQSFVEIDEEITILFEGGKVVSIDGKSLWTILRICISSGNIGISDSPPTTGGSTSFAYKKWRFEDNEAVLDVVSCGPSYNATSHILDQSYSSSATTALFPFQATARYITVGSNPMLSYYATTDSSRPFILAVSSMVASKVTSAVFSLAKTLLTATGTIPGVDGGSSMANIAPATSIPLVLSLKDANRKITKIIMSPAAADGKYQLAALTDSLGRVTLLDVEEGEIIAMFKGIRNAQCGWVETMDDESESEEDSIKTSPERKKRATCKRITLFLVIYSPIRGVVEIHHMRHGTRVGNFSIGQGWNLITTASAPLGTSMAAGLSFYERGGRRGCRNAGLAKCFLISPQGEIKRVHVPFECAIKKPVNLVNVFKKSIESD
ncbi:Rab3 GTPase-activating protein non-catalytic subunit [Gigaspora margarita]|uniref:Rab3 GTPase-activating protein non-catalytic subunit n=2 Tax=Gigaspora margarita TaxID=4874 RepID=A0A8H4EQ60_GIGMA|nr:Rab3 GTPase-activating protein non-catalytic subunit [Gigaspora margarita]